MSNGYILDSASGLRVGEWTKLLTNCGLASVTQLTAIDLNNNSKNVVAIHANEYWSGNFTNGEKTNAFMNSLSQFNHVLFIIYNGGDWTAMPTFGNSNFDRVQCVVGQNTFIEKRSERLRIVKRIKEWCADAVC